MTRGVVSRIDFQPYSHSRADSHLVVQIDADEAYAPLDELTRVLLVIGLALIGISMVSLLWMRYTPW